jgi:hypothetical protein
MAQTLYQVENAKFSNIAHKAARNQIYPLIFKTTNLEFEDTLLAMGERERILDGEMGVDRIVKVSVKTLHAPLIFTVQERFRRPEFAKYKDLTITEWNNASNLPSELYKINAGIFLYGYFDENSDRFLDAIAINVTDLLLVITRQKIKFDFQMNKKQQSFFAFSFDDLKSSGVVVYRMVG